MGLGKVRKALQGGVFRPYPRLMPSRSSGNQHTLVLQVKVWDLVLCVDHKIIKQRGAMSVIS